MEEKDKQVKLFAFVIFLINTDRIHVCVCVCESKIDLIVFYIDRCVECCTYNKISNNIDSY